MRKRIKLTKINLPEHIDATAELHDGFTWSDFETEIARQRRANNKINIAEAARMARVSRTTMIRWLQALELV